MEKNNYTWRERRVTLQPGINSITFSDTRPNHIVINNLSAAMLFLGVSVTPDKITHETAIDGFGQNMFARQITTDRCEIYNSATIPADILLTSFEAEFNPASITGNSITTGGGGGVSGSVTVAGFGSALPPGANNIGKVVVTEMPTQSFILEALPTGVNNIGKVDIAKLPALPAGTSQIGSVLVDNAIHVASMPAVSLNGNVTLSDTSFSIKGEAQYYSFNESVGITESVIILPFEIKTFKYISNDDPTNDLIIAFNTGLSSAAAGHNGTILLKAGEALQELNIKCTTIKFIRNAGIGIVRFVGV